VSIDEREQGDSWLRRLARAIGSGPAAAEPPEDPQLWLEERLLGGPRRYTRAEMSERIDLDRDKAARLWRALGMPEVGDHEVVFTEGDLHALLRLEKLRASGLVPDELDEAVTRAVSLAMAGLADWQGDMLYHLLEPGDGKADEQQVLWVVNEVLPLLRQMQSYIWRRHLAAAAGRLLVSDHEDSGTRELAVGFADMVEFTRATRELAPTELIRLIENFQGVAGAVVAGGNGRVVKTVGDEVLFTTDRPEDGAEIALKLLEEMAGSPELPDLRIGLALGDVVTRFGDVYGEAVNIAARLTTNARPGRVLVDRNLAASLEHDERFRLRLRRPLAVRGYRHLQSWGLRRAS
jgi:adenylate cyclase